jgi:hypothetical protein
MLDPIEAAAVAAQFGVADEQVQRDHLISHLLAVIARDFGDRVVFFGGTALARTHLPDGRLSEDLDLLAVPSRRDVAPELERALITAARREYGRLAWNPPLTAVAGSTPGVLRTGEGLAVRIQLLDPAGYPRWPTEVRGLNQRYTDIPSADLTVFTRPAFVAAKTAAWHDRCAARDLYDLWGLAGIEAIDAAAADLFVRLGPTGRPPAGWMFDRPPSAAGWQAQLGGQTRIAVSAVDALDVVREAWGQAVTNMGGER